MTDRELLEMAAKASGFKILRFGESEDYYSPCRGYVAFIEWPWPGDDPMDIPMEAEWNPLDDDEDALRLAVKLFLHVCVDDGFTEAQGDYRPLTEAHDGDPYAATRRAIVRAAAEIGRGMK